MKPPWPDGFNTVEALGWCLHENERLRTLGDDLADELEDAVGYIDDYFVKKHDMLAPLKAWRDEAPARTHHEVTR